MSSIDRSIVGGRSTRGVIADFIHKLRKNPKELEILGDGSQNKSYLYIKDLIDAVFVALANFVDIGEITEVYNVDSLDRVDVGTIAAIVSDEMGLQSAKFRFTGGVDCGRGWKGDVKTMSLSVNKLLDLG